MPKQVIVYHQQGCEACHEAMEYLTARGISFDARDVHSDRAALQELIQMRCSTTPVVLIDGNPIEGFDRARIDAALAER